MDLFTNEADPDNFRRGVNGVASALRASDWQCDIETAGDTFARITATRAGQSVSLDMGLDYRAHPPAILEVGPVLSLADAAGSKMATLYSR